MLDKDADEVADRFIAKLKNDEFFIASISNSEEDYDISKQARDSIAVDEFTQSDFYQKTVMGMR